MARLEMNFLGVPAISYQNQALSFRTRKALGLFVYLVVEAKPQSREKLAALFWPNNNAQQGRVSLRQTLARVRGILDETYLIVHRDHLGFNFDTDYQLEVISKVRIV